MSKNRTIARLLRTAVLTSFAVAALAITAGRASAHNTGYGYTKPYANVHVSNGYGHGGYNYNKYAPNRTYGYSVPGYGNSHRPPVYQVPAYGIGNGYRPYSGNHFR